MTTWTELHPSATEHERVNDMAFVAGECWTVSSAGFIRRTSSSGTKTQTIARGMTALHLRCLAMQRDGSTGWVGVLTRNEGARLPRMLRYTRGNGWTPVSNLPTDLNYGICGLRFAGDQQQTLFATGTYQETVRPAIWRCRLERPNDWESLPIQADIRELCLTQLIDMHFWTDKEGIAVGGGLGRDRLYRPVMLRTDNGGDRWRMVDLPDLGPTTKASDPRGRYAWKVFFVDDSVGFVSISNYAGARDRKAFILATTDAGRTWEPLPIRGAVSYTTNLRGVGFVRDGRGWTSGHLQRLVETDDGGATWRVADSPIRDANRFLFHEGDVYVAGNGLYRGT